MRIAIVKSSSVKVLILVSLLVPVLLSGCSSGSASVSTPTIGNVHCQATPSKCLPIVTATTVPATYVCSGKHNFRSNEGILKVVAYGRGDNARNEETELSDLSGDMAEQVGGCLTWWTVKPNRISVYFAPDLGQSDSASVAQWLRAQSKIVSRVTVVS
jgi:hypothetical protein